MFAQLLGSVVCAIAGSVKLAYFWSGRALYLPMQMDAFGQFIDLDRRDLYAPAIEIVRAQCLLNLGNLLLWVAGLFYFGFDLFLF